MIRCIECGKEQYIGALFCTECGAFLVEQISKGKTTILPFSEFTVHAPPPPLTKEELETAVNPRQVTFVIPSSRRRLQLELRQEIKVGRADAEMSPELDLTPDDGAEKGVSRLHASIKSVKKGIVLIDLDSTNGTMLNTYRLPPNRPYPLKNGDEIRFGDLLTHIFID
ncbi:MAG TPA: FHA domain-containing protein [Chloroflexota bacterium]|nr:FHA domain-containing protein [Chloroflexota bacterium]HUM69125.1 FHA domain-containing protein [Chloroflexota bacterium]